MKCTKNKDRREKVMSNLLEIRENIKRIYAKYEMYITPAFKFVLTLTALLMINSKLGYMSLLSNVFVVLMASVACAVLPWGFSLNFGLNFGASCDTISLYRYGCHCAHTTSPTKEKYTYGKSSYHRSCRQGRRG